MTTVIMPEALPDGLGDEVWFGIPIRPPRMARHNARFECSQIEAVREESLSHLSGSVTVVRQGAFLGIVARNIETALEAALALEVTWADSKISASVLPPSSTRSENDYSLTYTWPSRLPQGDWQYAVAYSSADGVRIWSPSRTPVSLRNDLAQLCDCEPQAVEIISNRGEGIVRGIEDDAAADAALMSFMAGVPVAVMPDAEHLHAPEQLGDACRIEWQSSIDTGHMRNVSEHWHACADNVPALALLLAGHSDNMPDYREPPLPSTSQDPGLYDFVKNRDSAADQMGDGAGRSPLPALFARESFMDEMAGKANTNPLQWRRDHLADARHRQLLDAVAHAAGSKTQSPDNAPESTRMFGRGVACDFDHSNAAAARSVWIVDLEVDRTTGAIELTRLLVGEDEGLSNDQAALQGRLETMLLGRDDGLLNSDAAEASDWDTNRMSLPAIETVTLPPVASVESSRQEIDTLPPSRVAPGVAAVANALFDATGIRLRNPPFDASRMRTVMAEQGLLKHDGDHSPQRTRRWPRWALLATAAVIGAGIALLGPFRGAIPKRSLDGVSGLYSQAAIDRGRKVAAAGDCAVCHTSEDGTTNAGGRAFETPFGTLYSTNITPDPKTGIGDWSYAAFARAMRQGISRDGHHLYPAFPYTAFAKVNSADMHALYAYLMTRKPIRQSASKNDLRFPFSLRPLMAGWNAIFLKQGQFKPDPSRSALYNRGKYLAEGLGHCAACHSPRNMLGAEKTGKAHFAGAEGIEGWDAPALNHLSIAPIPWSEQDIYEYLRTGQSDRHGVASGPMKPVVDELDQLSDRDVHAIAHYIASYSSSDSSEKETAVQAVVSPPRSDMHLHQGKTLFEKACAVCHEGTSVPHFNQAGIDLALNTNLHADSPTNVLQVITNGIEAHRGITGMPAFGDNMNNEQITALAHYMRHHFAPEAPQWQDVEKRLNAIRDAAKH